MLVSNSLSKKNVPGVNLEVAPFEEILKLRHIFIQYNDLRTMDTKCHKIWDFLFI
jgi:hypothetical protein